MILEIMEKWRLSNMKRIVLLAMLTAFIAAGIGCGGGTKINTVIIIPELDRTQFNDTAYIQGWENLKAGKPDLAIKNFQESNSVDEKLFVGFGYAFLAQNKLNLARRNFDQALAINPKNLQAQLGLATLYEISKENDKAFQVYAGLKVLYPENSYVNERYTAIKSAQTRDFLNKASLYKQENKTDLYIDSLKKAAAYSPENTDIEIEIANFYLERQEYLKAAQHYENVLDSHPENEEILLKLAEVYEKSQKFDSAVVVYRRLQKLKPEDITYINKVSDLKVKFYELNMPEKFKNIFFKQDINREELAALIGHYFNRYLETRSPVIITDIGNSFAKEHIIKIATLQIMEVRPDHSFDRFRTINRTDFAVVINRLVNYLREERGLTINFPPPEHAVEPIDISPVHKYYNVINFLLNSQLIKSDDENKFNPTAGVTPAEVLISIRKILNCIDITKEG